MLNFIATPNAVANSECGYALRLTFCHFADKNRYAQIISGYVRDDGLWKNKILSDENQRFDWLKSTH